jgi:hypothetical protein
MVLILGLEKHLNQDLTLLHLSILLGEGLARTVVKVVSRHLTR